MRKEGNKKPYFDKLQSISPADSLIDIIEDLKESMEQHLRISAGLQGITAALPYTEAVVSLQIALFHLM